MTSSSSSTLAPYGATLLRVTLGTLFLIHALTKIFVFTPAGTVAFFNSLGLPPAIAYLTMALESLLAVSLILGVYARWIGLLGIPLLIGTIVSAHGANGFSFANPGGGWEYPAMWSIALVVLFLIGDGRFALKSR
jgi:putative oxidoreductase